MQPKRLIIVALRVTVLTLLVTGVAYPLATTGLAQLLFPERANGSLVVDTRGRVVGSRLIAQPFTQPHYFWPRPSAAGEHGYDGAGSAASNWSVTSHKLRERIAHAGGGAQPADLITASASGLDPHLSPAAARSQIARVAAARGVAPERVRQLVEVNLEGRDFGFLGEPRVNVLLLNLALDQQFGLSAAR